MLAQPSANSRLSPDVWAAALPRLFFRQQSFPGYSLSARNCLTFVLFIPNTSHSFCRAPCPKPAMHEFVQISIHHTLNVAGLDTRSQVLDHSIGLKYITANLVAPRNASFFAVESLHLL